MAASRLKGSRRHGRGEVAVLDQRLHGREQRLARGLGVVAPLAAAQRAAHALGLGLQQVLEAAVEGGGEQRLGVAVGGDLEERVDAGLDRVLAQQIGAQAVDGADAGDLELLERGGEQVRARRRR